MIVETQQTQMFYKTIQVTYCTSIKEIVGVFTLQQPLLYQCLSLIFVEDFL